MDSVKKDLARGILFTAIAKYSGIIVQLIVTAVLSRLLVPSDFGIVAIAMVFITFFNIFTDIGIGPAIIQNKDLTKGDLSHIFSLTCYIGLFCSLLFYCLSWTISAFYNNPRLIHICQLLSIPILLTSLDIVPNGLLLKAKRFKYIAVRTLLAQFVSGCCAITAALCGWKIYALLVAPILSGMIIFMLNYRQYPQKFHWRIKMDPVKRIFSFSIYQFLFNFINYFSRNLDKLLVGKFLGMTPLGYYEKSYRLMMLPLQNITFVITPAFQPVFSQFQNDYTKLAHYYNKILYYLSWLAFPLTVLLFFISREAVLLFFGNQWENSVPVFRILTLSVFMQILISTTGSIYQSANATKQMFISGLYGAFFIISGFTIPIFIFGTLESVAYGFLCAQFANFIQSFWLLFRILHYPLQKVLLEWLHPLLFSIFLFLFFYIFSDFILPGSSLIITLIIKTILWLIIVIAYVQFKNIINVRSFIKERLQRLN